VFSAETDNKGDGAEMARRLATKMERRMAEISASRVMELRQRTGLGMMECKKALTEAAGDMTKAEEIGRAHV